MLIEMINQCDLLVYFLPLHLNTQEDKTVEVIANVQVQFQHASEHLA